MTRNLHPQPRTNIHDDAEARERRVAYALLAQASLHHPVDVAALLDEHDVIEAARLYAGDSPSGRQLREHALRHLSAAAATGARLITPDDEEQWPDRFTSHASTFGRSTVPVAVWARGAANLTAMTRKAVAIVADGPTTAYGDHAAAEFAQDLARRGWTIIGIGTTSIDAAAHHAGLDWSCALTVLDTGIDHRLPHPHNQLTDTATGLVVSEYAPGTAPAPGHSPARHRLLTALAHVILVVEAPADTPAVTSIIDQAHTVARPVFAVPGPATSPNSEGCHLLIGDRRATLAASARDILNSLPDHTGPAEQR